MKSAAGEISDKFLLQLRDDLACRRVEHGMTLLERHRHLLTHFDPSRRNAGILASYLAQWVDIGFRPTAPIRDIVRAFSATLRACLTLKEYLHLRVAEGMVAMSGELTGEAIRHFDFVLGLAEEAGDKTLLFIAWFWRGRCLRMQGEYDQALESAVKGRDIASKLGYQPTAAVIRVLESWLYFQKGDAKQATSILQESEAVLRQTDDYLTLGNIHSSYGRIAGRQGRYQHAIDSFTTAISLYKKRDPEHRNLARSLNNMAHVKRLVALQLRRQIDAQAARLRKAAVHGLSDDNTAKTSYRRRFDQLQREALSELAEASAIYQRYENHHGLGSVKVNYAYLHLDTGDLDRAEAAAETAFRLGEEKRDHILMARARMLRCMIANARVEEGIGESTEPGGHARLAQEYANEAVELAKHTQNRRLLAHTYIWQGLTHCNRVFDDPEVAHRCYEQAISLSKDGHAENAWEDLKTLKAKVLRSASVNPRLRAWSEGSVGDKTFQQVSEEFAQIVIAKVWEREGRRVSRVAARLSVSPKKIRRILTRAGRRMPPKG